eukprot:EC119645.1.p1 GENE.EC119645.1~~EC119645.1.p1  ORF type:complete len:137 (+),score=8.06 EC119645.1:68-478(+)
MAKQVVESGIPGMHFYTLNLEKSAIKILEGLGLVSYDESQRILPWRPPTNQKRVKENVRPIFWANRPKSYLSRTMAWDDFANGRWGDSTSPAYGELNDYHLLFGQGSHPLDRKAMWGEQLEALEDVYAAFVRFCEG